MAQSIEATKAFIRGCFEKQPTAEEFETILAFNMVVPAKIRGWLRRPAPSYEQALKAVTVPTLVTHGVEDKSLVSVSENISPLRCLVRRPRSTKASVTPRSGRMPLASTKNSASS